MSPKAGRAYVARMSYPSLPWPITLSFQGGRRKTVLEADPRRVVLGGLASNPWLAWCGVMVGERKRAQRGLCAGDRRTPGTLAWGRRVRSHIEDPPDFPA
jgi:hypothetical protein